MLVSTGPTTVYRLVCQVIGSTTHANFLLAVLRAPLMLAAVVVAVTLLGYAQCAWLMVKRWARTVVLLQVAGGGA